MRPALSLSISVLLLSSTASAAFDVAKARRKARAYEELYRKSYAQGVCPAYGRFWANHYARRTRLAGSDRTVWQRYVEELAAKRLRPERLDCTLYAHELLKAGMDAKSHATLLAEHRRIWKGRGFAGWSVAHILTEKLGWKAYAILHRSARYYHFYKKRFVAKRLYPVWKQPDIRIEAHYELGKDDRAIEALLRRGRFGWGFSDGGIHTWVTSDTTLKECHWESGPSRRYEIPEAHPLAAGLRREPFFESTRLVEFTDYGAHLVVFPPER